MIGAARYERTDSRVNERNGSRPQVVSMAVVVATGISADGGEVLGLVTALKRSFQGAAHQRCWVHFRPELGGARAHDTHRHGRRRVPHDLCSTDATTVAATWDEVRDQLAARFPKIGTLMDAAKGGSIGVHRVSPIALTKDLEH